MSNAKKLVILTLTMIFAIAVSATIVSFSFAGGASKDASPSLSTADDDTASESTSSLADTLTNIDHIIDKALDTSLTDDERIFHIVQIVSNGSTDTSFKTYVEKGYFREYVINANRSDGHDEMPETVNGQASIQIDVLTIADLQGIVTADTIDYSRINIADLIYISNDPSDPYVGGANDIPEDIHKLIQPYVSGDYKPLIIDSPVTSTDSSNPYSMTNLVTNVLAGNYVKYRTFGWDTSMSLSDFLNRKNGSLYIPLEITDENYGTSVVLVIYGDGNSSTMYNTLSADDTFLNNAYYSKGYKPSNVKVERISYTEITDSSFADDYDFVFIENDTYGSMTQTIYNAISAVSYAKKHVIYASSLKSASTASASSDNESNYYELYTMVASDENISLYSNVYISSYTFFDAMVSDPAGTQEAANAIAKLLNSSTYREYGADSASGKKYTVLEIQPAYPIDTELAEENGTYYTVPSNVYKYSKELTPSGSEYYAFEMTMEKVMALTGLDSSQIELVQVSTEELQGMKTSITDKYDLVYIGGNVSALREIGGDTTSQYYTGDSNYNVNTDYNLANGYYASWQLFTDADWTYFQMYSHSGVATIMNMGSSAYGVSSGDYANAGGNDLTAANLENLISYIDAGMPIVFSDDVTDAYLALKDYDNVYENRLLDPDSNMYKLLAYALEGKDVGSQDSDGNDITADYTLNTADNVLAGFDKDDTIRIANLSGEYGDSSISGSMYVEVFDDGELDPYMIKNTKGEWEEAPDDYEKQDAADTAGGQLKTLIASCATRPTMNLTSMPSVYVANTSSSYLTTPTLNFQFELLTNGNTSITSFTVNLYIDDNSNGLFTDSGECVKSVTVSVSDGTATGALSYEMSSDFYGPVSWKIEAVANVKSGSSTVEGPSVSYSAVSKVARTTQEKELVHILQIMPMGSTQQDKTTLYFCTECQLSNTNAMFNLHLNSAPTGTGTEFVNALYQNYESRGQMSTLKYDIGDVLTSSGNTYRYRNYILSLIEGVNNGTYEHFGIGLHEHNFGIWKYDSDLGYDDWNSNLADTLLGEDGDFEFKIDIFGPEDLDEMNAEYSSNDVAKLQEKYEALKADADAEASDVAAAKAAIEKLEDEKLQEAAEIYEEYENLVTITEEKETDLKNVLQYLVDNESTLSSTIAGIKDYSVFAEVLEDGDYYEIFSQNRTSWRDYDNTINVSLTFTAQKADDSGTLVDTEYKLDNFYNFTGYYYQNWADAKSKEILKLEEYWEAVRAAYGKDWMEEVYGMVIIGAAEDFNNQDLTQEVCDTLADYEAGDGNILLFHDTMAKKTDGAVNLTNTLRDACGLNRYHMSVSSTDSSQYQVDSGYDSSKYFLTKLTISDTGNVRSASVKSWSSYTRSLVGMSTAFSVYNTNNVSLPYKYAVFDDNVAITWMQDFKTYQTNMASGSYGTNRATQINSGIITSYPFKISATLNISGTHNQYLALDVEDDEVITWYALSAANNKREGSSIYAADPADSSDNYFIYSKGNVSYCGAGHAKVTGPLTDNNDERMLFINIICNSARKNALKPSIKVYDPDSKKVVPSSGNKYILQNDDGEPYIEVTSMTDSIKFGFLATVDTTASDTIEKVRIYFKYTDSETQKEVDEVIYTFSGDTALTSGIDYYINSSDGTNKKIAESIQLKADYFNGYDDCAYVYIEVTDSNGEVLIEKIRIDLVRELFDLTDNTVEQTPTGAALLDYIKDL